MNIDRLMRPEDAAQLLERGHQQARVKGTKDEIAFVPLVRLILPMTQCEWLITEIEPDDPFIAFGAADLGLGFPELGAIWLPEIAAVRAGPFRVVQDKEWKTSKPLTWWIKEAQARQSLGQAIRDHAQHTRA